MKIKYFLNEAGQSLKYLKLNKGWKKSHKDGDTNIYHHKDGHELRIDDERDDARSSSNRSGRNVTLYNSNTGETEKWDHEGLLSDLRDKVHSKTGT